MTDQQQTTTVSPFWRRLFAIREREDRAALAKLRRAVASPVDGDVFAVLGDALGEVRDRDLDAHLFIACLFAIHPTRGSGESLGGSMHRLRLKLKLRVGADSLDGRFAAILNSDAEDLPGRLRHIIRLLASHDVTVDYPRLLHDMLRWGADDRHVQRCWARDYWTAREEADEGRGADEAAASDAAGDA
jgi:CRISPR type I-E-associated protein CasB/Cse2